METQIEDRLRLNFAQSKALHQSIARFFRRFRCADERNHLINVEDGYHQALKDMLAPLGCIKIKLRAPRDDIFLMGDVISDQFFQAHLLWFSLSNRDHVHAERHLKIGVFIKVLQDFFRIRILFDFNYGAHSHAVGLIPNVADAGKKRLFLLCDAKDFLKRFCFIDLIWQFMHNDEAFPVFKRFNFCFCPHCQLAAPCFVCSANFLGVKKIGSGRKIRAWDNLHQFVKADVRMIHLSNHGIDCLVEIMRRDIRCKANRNAACPIHKQIREAARQQIRFLLRVVEIQAELHGILFDVSKKLQRKRRHACFRIAHRSCTVAIHRTEIAMPIHKRHLHIEVLRHAHHCIINRAVAMRMIFTKAIAHNARALPVRLVRCYAKAHHRVKDTALHRF